MPNHIKNRITIIADNSIVKSIREKYTKTYPAKIKLAYDGNIICINKKDNAVGWFDPKTAEFTQRNKDSIFGLPEGFEFEIKETYNQLPDFEKIVTPPNDDAYNDLPDQETAKKSPNWWRTWNLENWGSKWNSYSCDSEDYNSFTFETAWSGVPELMAKISEQNIGVEFLYEFADEDTGFNCGFYKFKDGITLEKSAFTGGSKEAYEMAFSLRPEHKEYYSLIDGNYESIEY